MGARGRIMAVKERDDMEQQTFTVIVEQRGDLFVAHCPELPQAKARGGTVHECCEGMRQAIHAVLKGTIPQFDDTGQGESWSVVNDFGLPPCAN